MGETAPILRHHFAWGSYNTRHYFSTRYLEVREQRCLAGRNCMQPDTVHDSHVKQSTDRINGSIHAYRGEFPCSVAFDMLQRFFINSM